MIPVIVFPFDGFGNAGTGAGAQLLADVVKEIQEDAQAETRPSRTAALKNTLHLHEVEFTTPDDYKTWLKTGKALAKETLEDNPFTMWLGGNHLAVLPVYQALGPGDLVIQWDAHLDCYHFHDTVDHLSPGNFLRELGPKAPRVINLGHRDLFMTDQEVARTLTLAVSALEVMNNTTKVLADLQELIRTAKRVWIDIDADVFDPAYCPAVHNPLPVGLAPGLVLNLLDAIWCDKICGVSLSEFDPGRDKQDTSLQLLSWCVEWLLLRRLKA